MKLSVWIAILVAFLLSSMLGYLYKRQWDDDFEIPEHFDDYHKTDFKTTVDKIYDSFYSNVYDQLFANEIKDEFEIYNIVEYTIKEKKSPFPQKSKTKWLDLGCGTGHHMKILYRDQYPAVGVDISKPMIQKAKQVAPDATFVAGDFTNKSLFPAREFTHVGCFFYAMYYADAATVFENANYWLKPKGFFCVHLINPIKFDPVLEKSSKLIPLYNPQKHLEQGKRNTKTKLKFNKFNYMADWKFQKQNTQFIEHFFFPDGMVRQNIHKMTIYPIKYYVQLAKKNGFQLKKIVDLTPVNHEYNYVYMFQKQFGDL